MYQKVSKYYDYDGRNKIGTFKIAQKVMHRYIYAKIYICNFFVIEKCQQNFLLSPKNVI